MLLKLYIRKSKNLFLEQCKNRYRYLKNVSLARQCEEQE